MHLESLATSVFAGLHAIGDAAHPIIKQRPIDEARPDVQRPDQLARKAAKSPGFISVHDQLLIAGTQAVIEVHNAGDEFGWENPDAAVVEQVDAERLPLAAAGFLEHRIIAEMRIAMDHAEAAER